MAKNITAREDALEALRIVERNYGPGWYERGSEKEEQLVDILTAPTDHDGSRGEQFRTSLEGIRRGGGASKRTTFEVFGALGRLDETNQNWI